MWSTIWCGHVLFSHSAGSVDLTLLSYSLRKKSQQTKAMNDFLSSDSTQAWHTTAITSLAHFLSPSCVLVLWFSVICLTESINKLFFIVFCHLSFSEWYEITLFCVTPDFQRMFQCLIVDWSHAPPRPPSRSLVLLVSLYSARFFPLFIFLKGQ